MDKYIKDQYNYAKAQGWIPSFKKAAKAYNFKDSDLMGLASRESNMKNIKGDYHDGAYHGFSLMQLDIQSHKAWIESGSWQNVDEAIMKGAAALAEKRDQIINASKMSKVSIRFRSGKKASFTPKPFNDSDLRKMTFAAYNCGLAAYYHYSIGNPIDAGTAHKTYSTDVVYRAVRFAELLAAESPAPNPVVVVTPDPQVTTQQPEVSNPDPSTPGINFDDLQGKASTVADFVSSRPSFKEIAARAGMQAFGWLVMIWGSGVSGKIAIILTSSAIGSLTGYFLYVFRHHIFDFFKQAKNYIFSKVGLSA